MKPTAVATEIACPSAQISQKPHKRERHRRHDEQRVARRSEQQVEQHEDEHQRQRHDEFEPLGGALQVLELPRPGHRVAGRHRNLRCHSLLHVPHDRAQIAPRTSA